MPIFGPRVAILAATVIAAATACSGGGDDGPACAEPTPAPAAQREQLPDGLDLTRVGTVTRVTKQDGHLLARLDSGAPLQESTVAMQDALVAAGYRPAGMDNEGFEAEVFFTSGSYAAGQALFRSAGCGDRWDIELVIIDPGRLPPSTPSPSSRA